MSIRKKAWYMLLHGVNSQKVKKKYENTQETTRLRH